MNTENKFYTATPIVKNVKEEEFYNFIKNYPRKLEKDVCGIFEPPAITYNDFELANRWPYSVVAKTWYYSNDINSPFYVSPEERKYQIVSNVEELFMSKTGYQKE